MSRSSRAVCGVHMETPKRFGKGSRHTVHIDDAATHIVDCIFPLRGSACIGSQPHVTPTKLVYTTVRKSDTTDPTLETLCARLAWSMNALAAGTHPEQEWAGRLSRRRGMPVAGKCVQLRGDWEFFNQALNFPSPTDVDAAHVLLLRDIPKGGFGLEPHGSWRAVAHHAKRTLPTLRDLCLFKIQTLRLERVCIDVMHTVDLGVTSHVVGIVFDEVAEATVYDRAQALGRLQRERYNRKQERLQV